MNIFKLVDKLWGSSVIAVGITALAFFAPLIQMATHIFPDYIAEDHRELSKKPGLNQLHLTSTKKFIEDFEAYFNDHFGLRGSLLRLNGLLSFHVLKKSPVSYVVIGRNGWLFYNHPTDGMSLPDFTGNALYTSDELHHIQKYLMFLKSEFHKRNIEFVIVLAPNKHTIYFNKLPSEILSKKGTITRADQLDDLLSKINITFIDLRQELLTRKAETSIPLYFLTDTHWNKLGAFYAYHSINKELQKKFPQIPMLELSDFQVEIKRNRGQGDIARMSNIAGTLDDQKINLLPSRPRSFMKVPSEYGYRSFIYEIPNSKLPVLLMYRDSFSTALSQFLPAGFSRSVLLWKQQIDFADVDKEKPNIVILELVERYSGVLLGDTSNPSNKLTS